VEIEHAIDNIKRTKFDRRMRSEWHRAAARRGWTPERKARWAGWKEQQSREEVRDGDHQPDHALVAQSKVWIKGHVPKEFLNWVGRHWSHDNETRVMLSGCCFEAWDQ